MTFIYEGALYNEACTLVLPHQYNDLVKIHCSNKTHIHGYKSYQGR